MHELSASWRMYVNGLSLMHDLLSRSGPWSGYWIQSEIRVTMKLQIQFCAASLYGGGSDFVGPFSINGVVSPDLNVQFAKRYSTFLVLYRGRWDGTLISGEWSLQDFDSYEPLKGRV